MARTWGSLMWIELMGWPLTRLGTCGLLLLLLLLLLLSVDSLEGDRQERVRPPGAE